VATLIEEITVEGDSQNVVHKNYVLVRAEFPEEAYEKAQDLGKSSDVSYDNPKGSLVQIKFRGLSELNVVYDQLEHGAELHYDELLGLSEERVGALLRPKKDLAAFKPVSPSAGPDYSSRDVLEDAKQIIERAAGKGGHKR
jgi:hypothetical protein